MRPSGYRITFYSFLVCLLIVCGSVHPADAANLFINLVAVNGSDEKKEYPVKYYLPKELEPNHILSTSGLNVDYDVDRKSYYVHGSVELGPKETKTIKIEVTDVWQIKREEVDILKQQLEDNLRLLENGEFYEGAQLIKDRMINQLDEMLAEQNKYADNVERRIEQYRAYADVLEKIRNNAFSLDYLRKASVVEENTPSRTVKFFIQVENPQETGDKKVVQKHYLPSEVKPEDVVDSQGFEVRFDEDRNQCYLLKEETLKAKESKRYEIVIKDIWSMPQAQIDNMQEKTDTIFAELKGSEYEESAQYLFSVIGERLQAIENTQQDRQNIRQYIGAFRVNQKRFDDAKQDVQRLEQMLAIVKAKKLEELESGKVKNVLQKLKALTGIAAISAAIFGAKPTTTTTWKVIWGIMIFVAFFTALHFFTWWRKSQIAGEGSGVKSGETIQPAAKPGQPADAEKK